MDVNHIQKYKFQLKKLSNDRESERQVGTNQAFRYLDQIQTHHLLFFPHSEEIGPAHSYPLRSVVPNNSTQYLNLHFCSWYESSANTISYQQQKTFRFYNFIVKVLQVYGTCQSCLRVTGATAVPLLRISVLVRPDTLLSKKKS